MDRALEPDADSFINITGIDLEEPGTADKQGRGGGVQEEQQRFQSFFNAAIYDEDDEQISYLKLQRHIQTNHPVDEAGEPFGLTATIGSLGLLGELRGCGGAGEGADEGRHTEAKEEKRIEITRL